MAGVFLILIGVCMWSLAFTDVIPGVGGLMFLFFGGVLIGSGIVQAVSR